MTETQVKQGQEYLRKIDELKKVALRIDKMKQLQGDLLIFTRNNQADTEITLSSDHNHIEIRETLDILSKQTRERIENLTHSFESL